MSLLCAALLASDPGLEEEEEEEEEGKEEEELATPGRRYRKPSVQEASSQKRHPPMKVEPKPLPPMKAAPKAKAKAKGRRSVFVAASELSTPPARGPIVSADDALAAAMGVGPVPAGTSFRFSYFERIL